MTLKPYPKTRLHIIFSEFSGMDKDLMKNREIYAFSLIIALLNGLAFLQIIEICHCDWKPENLLFDDQNQIRL